MGIIFKQSDLINYELRKLIDKMMEPERKRYWDLEFKIMEEQYRQKLEQEKQEKEREDGV